MDAKTKKRIIEAAEDFAVFLNGHPMLGALLSNAMVRSGIQLTDENRAAMLEETAAHLNRMVNGSGR